MEVSSSMLDSAGDGEKCSGAGRGDRIVGGRQCMRSGRRRDGAGEGIRDFVL